MSTGIDILEKYAKCLADSLGGERGRYEYFVASQAKAIVKQRIFKGIATDGQSLGTYAPSTFAIRKRANRGESTKIDLQFTDQLFRSIDIGKSRGRAALMVVNDSRKEGNTNSDVMDDLEKRFKKPIFTASDDEKNDIAGQLAKLISKDIDKFAKDCFPTDNTVKL